MPTEAHLAEFYQKVYAGPHLQEATQEANIPYYQSHIRQLRTWSELHLGKSSNLCMIDVGTAKPTLLQLASQDGSFNRLYGVEHDVHAREFGAAQGITMVEPAEFSNAIPSEAADIIRFSHVLEHAIDPLALLMTAVQKSVLGGLIYITQPMFPVFGLNGVVVPEIADAVFPEHLHFFNALSLRCMLERAGCDIIEVAAAENIDRLAGIYADALDVDYCAAKTSDLSDKTPSWFDLRGGYPTFFGTNLHLLAKVKA
jgi:Methyltransferase domain